MKVDLFDLPGTKPKEQWLAPAMAATSAAGKPVECTSPATPLIDQAIIALDGDWAEVSVPRPLLLSTER